MNDSIRSQLSGAASLVVLAAVVLCAPPCAAQDISMPSKGISAHRGASVTHPENTLASIREAIWLGAQQIEVDVVMTADGELVLMHDGTVDRTTDGSGTVSSFTLAQIKQLDAGSWKDARFTGERVPTLDALLELVPDNVWLNLHLRDGYDTAYATAMKVFEHSREHQAFLAGTASQIPGALAAAADTGKTILTCNMQNQSLSSSYVTDTINGGFDFLQFLDTSNNLPAPSDVARLHDAGALANFYGVGGSLTTANQERLRTLFEADIDFPLVDDAGLGVMIAEEYGIEPLRGEFRQGQNIAVLGVNCIVNPGAELWYDDSRQVTTYPPPPASGTAARRDRELWGWIDLVEITNEGYGADDLPDAEDLPAASVFGRCAFVGGYVLGPRWIWQEIDLSEFADSIDAGELEYTLSGWLGGAADQSDFTGLSVLFRDADGLRIDETWLTTLDPADWGGETNLAFLETSGTAPPGTRSADARLYFSAQSGDFCRGMADNLSLVFNVSGAGAVPEPSAWTGLVATLCGMAFSRYRIRHRRRPGCTERRGWKGLPSRFAVLERKDSA